MTLPYILVTIYCVNMVPPDNELVWYANKINIDHCDLFSWFIEFAVDLQDNVMFKHNDFGL